MIAELLQELYKKQGALHAAEDQLKECKTDLETLQNYAKELDIIQVLFQKVAQETQEQLKYHLEDVVQLAIDTCFPGEYKFSVSFELLRGKTEAHIVLIKNGKEIDPLTAVGGGLVDLLSFALRISIWTLTKTRNTIILDEPFKHLSENLHSFAGEFLKTISKKMGIQFIMVSHNKTIIDSADNVITIGG